MKHRKNKLIIELFIFLLLITSIEVSSQKKLKYKKVYESVLTKKPTEVYPLLLEFQRQDPFHVNTYFQLAVIAERWSKTYDPLRSIDDVKYFIYNTRLFYGLAKSKMTTKEVRKNRKYYNNLGIQTTKKKIQFEDINSLLDSKITENKTHDNNINVIYNNYNISLKHYSNCVKIFKKINQEHNKLKDLYLVADNSLNVELNKLSALFDSTLYYFQEYKTLISNYPIKDYNQKYKLLPIEVYRLHGLTTSVFLENDIRLWNYGKWVGEVKSVINGDIKKIRKNITETDNQLSKKITEFKNYKGYSNNLKGAKVDEKKAFLINKYDFKSLTLALFKFKESKIDYLLSSLDEMNNPDNNISIVKKAKYYEKLIYKKKKTDSLNRYFKSLITPLNISKYKNFIDTKYRSEAGLNSYYSNETKALKSNMDNNLNNLKKVILKNINKYSELDSVMYKNKKISLKNKYPDFENANLKSYYTTTVKTFENYTYVAGYYKQSKTNISSFIAKFDKSKKIEWLKNYNISNKTNDCISKLYAYENGCYAVVESTDNEGLKNTLLSIDKSGKELLRKEINSKYISRYLDYDDINELIIVAFKGTNYNPLDNGFDSLSIYQLNLKGDINWNKKIKIEGNLVNIIKMNKTYVLFNNFSRYINNTGKLEKNISGGENDKSKTNLIAIQLNEFGKIINEKSYLSEKPYFIVKIVKINSEAINALGVKDIAQNFLEVKKAEKAPLFYSLINSKLQQYYTNWYE